MSAAPSTPPNVISVQQLTVVDWIKTALSQTILPPTNEIVMNGYSGNEQVKEAIETLALMHKTGGVKAATTAWESRVAKTVPDVVQKLEASRYLLHASELGNLPPVNWLINGIIPERGLSILYGEPKSGKSFWALDAAEAVALRRPVVYIAAEGESGYQYRHAAWMKFHKITKPSQLYFWVRPVKMMQKSEVEAFIEIIAGLNPHLIVVDTLARCMSGGDENSQKDMNAFVESCDLLRERLRSAVLVLHHTNKGGDIRGSTVLIGAADSVFELKNKEGKVKVQCQFIKDSEPFETQMLKRVDVPLEPGYSSCVLIPATAVKTNTDELTPNEKVVIEWLSGAMFDRGARTSDLKQAVNLASTTFYDVINALSNRHIIYKDGRYDPWMLTEKGKELARRNGFIKVLELRP